MYKQVRNNTESVKIWCGIEFQPEDTYIIEASDELRWSSDGVFLAAVANNEAVINNGISDITNTSSAIDFLKNKSPIVITGEVTPKTIKNDHSMQPWGCVKGYVDPTQHICEIALSNKSQDGLTFTYDHLTLQLPLHVGDYVFQDRFCCRSWIVSFDDVNHTVTFEMPYLNDGVGVYTKGEYSDCLVRDWYNPMYLWGLDFSVYNMEKNDFMELSVVDIDDIFKDDAICAQIFAEYGVTTAAEAEPYILALGFEDIGEYGHWTKYYDEQWVRNADGKSLKTPDGAPGTLIPGLYLRISYFSTRSDTTITDFYIDYYPTAIA